MPTGTPAPGNRTARQQPADTPSARLGAPLGYLIAIVSCAVALIATRALASQLANVIFICFWPAVFVSAWFGGRGPSWLATVLAVLLVNQFFVEPVGSTMPESPASLIALGFFLVLGGSVGEVTARFRQLQLELRERAMDAADRADAAQEQAIELEAQTEEAQSLTEALEETNRELERLFRAEHVARTEAEAANKAKTDFLATMSHELRTPLNAIAGYAELLAVGILGPVTEKQQESLARIQRSQRHLLSLINDVLNFAKLTAGSVDYEITDVPVREAVEAVEDLVTPQFQAKSLEFARRECDDGHVVRADADKLQQILLNLLSNAIKFTPEGGRVTVSCEGDDATVSISVEDTGIGIPDDRLTHIFEPFVQVDRRLTSRHGGTGLGLAISRDLARAMGGEIEVLSKLGRGSRFVVRLPRA